MKLSYRIAGCDSKDNVEIWDNELNIGNGTGEKVLEKFKITWTISDKNIPIQKFKRRHWGSNNNNEFYLLNN